MTAAPAPSAVLDARQRGADPRVLGDAAGVVLRHVQVGTDEDAAAGQGAARGEIGEAEEGAHSATAKRRFWHRPARPPISPRTVRSHVPHREADPPRPCPPLAKDRRHVRSHHPTHRDPHPHRRPRRHRRRPGPAAAAAGGAAARRLATAGAASSPAPSSRCACSRCGSTSRSPPASPRPGCRWNSSTRTRRVLEGKLQFPLGAGQVVSGFALDIDGQMRDAVPVEKARAEQVFEDITRRRIDPGLLADDARQQLRAARLSADARARAARVVLTLVEAAPARLVLPLAYADLGAALRSGAPLRRGAAAAASVESGNPLGLRLRARSARRLQRPQLARRCGPAAREPAHPCAGRERRQRGRDHDRGAQRRDLLRPHRCRWPSAARRGRCRSSVQIVWDASGSGAQRQFDREQALLDAYFRRAGDTEVTLVRVADVAAAPERFSVRRGDWSALRRALQATVYDGASNLGAVRHDGVSAEALWFSDGLANYGAPWRLSFPVPVFTIGSTTSGDPSALRALAEASGGRSIDLQALTHEQAAAMLLSRGTELVEASALGASEIAVQSRHATAGRLVLAGVMTARSAELQLRLRGSDGAVTTRAVRIDAGRNASRLAGVQWARLTLASLEGEARLHKVKIRELGKRFGLATRETSLLVLERIDDYVRHEIEPPPALREAYERMAATMQKTPGRRATRPGWRRWCSASRRASPGGTASSRRTRRPPLAIAKSTAPRDALGTLQESRRERAAEAEADDSAAPTGPCASSRCRRPPPGRRRRRRGCGRPDGGGELAGAAKKDGSGGRSSSTSISIALQPAASNAAWMKRLEAAEPQARRAIYLDERQRQRDERRLLPRRRRVLHGQGRDGPGPADPFQPGRDGPAEPAGAAPARLPPAAGGRGRERRAAVRAGARARAERAAVAPRPRPGPGRGRPGAEGGRAAVRGGDRPLGRALPRHRPDRPGRAQRDRRQGGARRPAGRRGGDRAAAAEEPAPRRARGPRLGRRRHRRRPARDRPERRGGLLRPQPLLPGRHDHPRRDRRLRPGGVLAQGRQARQVPGRGQLLRPPAAGAHLGHRADAVAGERLRQRAGSRTSGPRSG